MATLPQQRPVSVVPSPAWSVIYKGVNITIDISTIVTKITYTTPLHGLAPELELEIADFDKRWQNASYPSQGDQIGLAIGYSDLPLIPCPVFHIDEVELDGPPDTLHFRGLAFAVLSDMRSYKTQGFESVTLLDIATRIAAKYNLTVTGIPNSLNPLFLRITQKQETDLAFLTRLGDEYGYNFSIRGSKMVFSYREAMEAAAPVATVTRADIEKFSFKNKTQEIFSHATLAYLDPLTKQTYTVTVDAPPPIPPGGPTLKLSGERVENALQAQLKATSILHKNNMLFTEGDFSGPGSTVYAGGNNINIQGFGIYDGKYLINEARHELEREAGYTTSCKIQRVFAA